MYRLSRYPSADRPDLIVWSLWSRNKQGEIQGTWSHETALDIYDLCDIMPAKLHMTVPKHFRKSVATPSALKLYHADLQKSDWVEQKGYRITTPIRTLADLATTRQISDDLLQQAVQEGRKRGMIIKHHIDTLPKNESGVLLRRFYEKK
jgi:predicted transcriptional regulator of viral defense system